MDNRSLQLIYLVAAIILLVAILLSRDNIEFSFYVLSLRWSPSACNQGSLKCSPDTLGYFTIHGLWPMYEDDKPVPPYDPKMNKCTDVTPTDPKNLLPQLKPIETTLQEHWPNYTNYANINMCAESWKDEWKKHGICSDYPADKPLEYFNATLKLAQNYNYDPLKGTKVVPREEPYPAREIVNAVKEKVKATPQILCNEKDGTLQLLEIRLCFGKAKPLTPIDCPHTFDPQGVCQQETDLVKFTPAPTDSHGDSQHFEEGMDLESSFK